MSHKTDTEDILFNEFIRQIVEWRTFVVENRVNAIKVSRHELASYAIKPITTTEIVSKDDRSIISAWLLDNKHMLENKSENKYWGDIANLKDVASEVYDKICKIKLDIIQKERLTSIWHQPCTWLPDLVILIDQNAQVDLHNDLDDVLHDSDLMHIRFNVMISRGEGLGGMPTVNSSIYDVNEGCYYCNLASEDLHGSTCADDAPRIGLSFGFIVRCVEFYRLCDGQDVRNLLHVHEERQRYYMSFLH